MNSEAEQSDSLVTRLMGLFLKGLGAIIPIALTLAIVIWLAGIAEKGIGTLIKLVLPADMYITGMGLVGGIVLVIAIGVLSQVWLFRKFIDLGEAILDRMPLIKSVFRATKDFVEYFSSSDTRRFSKVVMVRHPDLKFGLMGFITREEFSTLPFGEEGEVSVYLPMSYQIGGYTVFIPRDWCEPIDLQFEDALRLILTAGMSRRGG